MPYSSLAIANEFIDRGIAQGRPVTQMQLQKLVYLAHGWKLGVEGVNAPLIQDAFEAWDYGPVVRRLYEALRSYGSAPVTRLIKWGDDSPFKMAEAASDAREQIHPDDAGLLDAVWANYGSFHAFQLSALTHVDDSPWAKTFTKGKSTTIPNGEIAAYFKQLADNSRAGNAAKETAR